MPMSCNPFKTVLVLFDSGMGNDDSSSARGSPSAMELTVGGTLHRLDRTLNEEITHLTATSNASISSSSNATAAAAARRAARQAAFRASKNSSGKNCVTLEKQNFLRFEKFQSIN